MTKELAKVVIYLFVCLWVCLSASLARPAFLFACLSGWFQVPMFLPSSGVKTLIAPPGGILYAVVIPGDANVRGKQILAKLTATYVSYV